MANNSPNFLDEADPRLKLKVGCGTRNIFVTQLGESREEKNVNHIPVVTETASRILETGVNTLQQTLVLKRQVELDDIHMQLLMKQEEFKGHMNALAQRRAELELKQQETKNKVKKFEKFMEDNELKRHRALKKCQVAREQNLLKKREIEDLTEQLEKLQLRQQSLKKRVSKYKIFEYYLMNILDYLPENYLEYGSDSLVMPIIRRHETLSITHQDLMLRIGQLVEELERGQRQLEILKQEHTTNKLTTNKELSELQSQWDRLKEQNNQTEVNLLMDQGQSRDKVEEFASLFIAMRNLGEQCYLHTYGPLNDMDMLTMMDMVKEYILEKTDTGKKATRLMECGSAMTAGTDLADKSVRVSVKTINSKTQLKSSSKVSGKSGISS
ncbi:coiled-coil domain-containing protein 42 homolog [Lampris incognitus]|uniref:coiled-coil domain-containing protein 42 homolog n=1 Tax=Lampris incognitus TaxID=2546036 RepID=UPI0024B5B7FC|nr:coiled-coil domain-containing protein 42 homolog [Lampris incognitus]